MMIPPSRPKRDKGAVEAVLERYGIPFDRASLVFVRGHYLDTLGQRGCNDINIYDDSCYLYAPGVLESWNANTDPAFFKKNGRGLAQLSLGHLIYYPDLHHPGKKTAYWALRPYPEGAILKCTREGAPSTCQSTNIHMGGFNQTNSEGCLTIYKAQYPDFKLRVQAALEKFPQVKGTKTRTGAERPLIDVVLIENRLHGGQQFWTDHEGKIV